MGMGNLIASTVKDETVRSGFREVPPPPPPPPPDDPPPPLELLLLVLLFPLLLSFELVLLVAPSSSGVGSGFGVGSGVGSGGATFSGISSKFNPIYFRFFSIKFLFKIILPVLPLPSSNG